ncbi:MAG: glycerol-3-phosphate responsive antiterminator [Lachnospiraceae bacterium]|nr:glycerol-3-phosphate responsive antiterminator [Lachnospiraceae bacterium]
MNKKYREAFEDYPIIAAIRDDEGLTNCLKTECQNIFILYGTVINIADIVDQIKEAGKYAFVHMDMIEGLSSKEVSVDYIKQNTKADGIISTKSSLIKRAKELELFTIQRFFLLDSLAIKNVKKQIEQSHPDFIEILPGVMPRVLSDVCRTIDRHVIAGGLISYKEDIIGALDAGATAISTTNQGLWYM